MPENEAQPRGRLSQRELGRQVLTEPEFESVKLDLIPDLEVDPRTVLAAAVQVGEIAAPPVAAWRSRRSTGASRGVSSWYCSPAPSSHRVGPSYSTISNRQGVGSIQPSRRRGGLAAHVLRALGEAYAPRRMWYDGPVSPKGEALLDREDPGWRERATGLDREHAPRRRRTRCRG